MSDVASPTRSRRHLASDIQKRQELRSRHIVTEKTGRRRRRRRRRRRSSADDLRLALNSPSIHPSHWVSASTLLTLASRDQSISRKSQVADISLRRFSAPAPKVSLQLPFPRLAGVAARRRESLSLSDRGRTSRQSAASDRPSQPCRTSTCSRALLLYVPAPAPSWSSPLPSPAHGWAHAQAQRGNSFRTAGRAGVATGRERARLACRLEIEERPCQCVVVAVGRARSLAVLHNFCPIARLPVRGGPLALRARAPGVWWP